MERSLSGSSSALSLTQKIKEIFIVKFYKINIVFVRHRPRRDRRNFDKLLLKIDSILLTYFLKNCNFGFWILVEGIAR